MKKPLIIIAGPTAAGKTALSVRLAARIGGEIISADSMQVYRGMDIGTAKVTREEMQGIPHHLIDVLDPSEPFNVFTFRRMALDAMAQIHAAGHVPVLVGGTGFYIQSVLYDIDFDDTASDEALRRQLEREMEEGGEAAMHARLAAVDPASAEAIHPNNRKRVIRALEFYLLTGKPISEHNRAQREKESPFDFLYYVLTMDRQELYRRIDLRAERMVEAGLVEEVRGLQAQGLSPDLTSIQGLGYKQMLDYLAGNASLADAVSRIRQETRHFAKRQLTWFRREPEARWLYWEDFGNDPERLLRHVEAESLALRNRCGFSEPHQNITE